MNRSFVVVLLALGFLGCQTTATHGTRVSSTPPTGEGSDERRQVVIAAVAYANKSYWRQNFDAVGTERKFALHKAICHANPHRIWQCSRINESFTAP